MRMGVTTVDGGPLEEMSKSEIFDVLRNKRRRYLLHYMKAAEGDVELGDLATRIAAWEYGEAVSEVTSAQRKRVYTTLQQTHLPKMDEAEIVEFDSDRGIVRRTKYTDQLSVYLEIVPRDEFPWREYYLGLGFVSMALVVALAAGIYPLTAVSATAWAGVIAVVLTVSALAHVYYERSMRLGADELPPELDP